MTRQHPTGRAERPSDARTPLSEPLAPSGALSKPQTDAERPDVERLGRYLEVIRYAINPMGPWGPEMDAAARAVIALADQELEEAQADAEQQWRNCGVIAREKDSYRRAWKDEQAKNARLRELAAASPPADRSALRDIAQAINVGFRTFDPDHTEDAQLSEHLAEAVLAVLPLVASCSCCDNPAFTAGIGYPVRCPHCPPGADAIPPTHWTKHVQRHHPEVPPVMPQAAEVRAAALNEAADAIDAQDLPQDYVDMFDNGARWATAELRRMAAETPQPKRPPMDPVHILGIDAEPDAVAQPETQDAALATMFEGLARLIATSSRDWGQYRVDAWLYAVLVGWDCEKQHQHDGLCDQGAAMAEMALRHGWDHATVAKARRYRAAVRAITEAATTARPDDTTGAES